MLVARGPARGVDSVELSGHRVNLAVQPDAKEVVDVPADALAEVVLGEESAALQAGGVVVADRVAAEQQRPGVDDSAGAHAPSELALLVTYRRSEPDRPADGGKLEMAVVVFVAQMRGEVRQVLDVVAESVGGDIGKWL